MVQRNKIDSNETGLRYAEEASPKVLPTSGVVWNPLGVTSYADFGGQVETRRQRVINDSRQLDKPVSVGVTSDGGFQPYLTQSNLQDLLQGFLFADARRKGDGQNSNVRIVSITGASDTVVFSNLKITALAVNAGGTGYAVNDTVTVSGGTSTVATTATVTAVSAGAVVSLSVNEEGRYSVLPGATGAATTTSGGGSGLTVDLTTGSQLTFRVGDIYNFPDASVAANQGAKIVETVTDQATIVFVDDLSDETPDATDDFSRVGFQFTAGDAAISASGGAYPQLTASSKNLTELGLVPGEPIYLGGDAALTAFTETTTDADGATIRNNSGWAQINTIAAGALEFAKTDTTYVTEAGGSQTIQIFFGRLLKNESDSSLIKRRTYNLERSLGAPDTAQPAQIQGEYVVGAVPNELTLNLQSQDLMTADLAFIGLDSETRTAAQGLKSGTRPDDVAEDAFNTSSDFSRLRLAIKSTTDSNPTALVGFLEEFTVSVSNNITRNNAVSVFGAFEATAGAFEVGGSATAYFSTVSAIAAVRNNSDVTLDFALAKNNSGVFVDVPLIGLGNGRLDVAIDEPITLPLELPAGRDRVFNTTLVVSFFDYLPNIAEAD